MAHTVWSWTMTHTSSLGSQNLWKTLAKHMKIDQSLQKTYVFIEFFDFFDYGITKSLCFHLLF